MARATLKAVSWKATKPAIDAILGARHGDPFALLGLHQVAGVFVIRALAPQADTLEAVSLEGALIAKLERRQIGRAHV